MNQNDAYVNKWPLYCRTCNGWGVTSHYELHDELGAEQFDEPCNDCISANRCPRCATSQHDKKWMVYFEQARDYYWKIKENAEPKKRERMYRFWMWAQKHFPELPEPKFEKKNYACVECAWGDGIAGLLPFEGVPEAISFFKPIPPFEVYPGKVVFHKACDIDSGDPLFDESEDPFPIG